MTDIDEFADELAALKTDSNLNWAQATSAVPVRRDKYYDDVSPSDEGASDYGLAIAFETAAGQEFTVWFPKPREWDILASNLVLLLEYWEVAPGDVDQIEHGEETYEVPISHNVNGDPEIDWQGVEHKLTRRPLEEGDEPE